MHIRIEFPVEGGRRARTPTGNIVHTNSGTRRSKGPPGHPERLAPAHGAEGMPDENAIDTGPRLRGGDTINQLRRPERF